MNNTLNKYNLKFDSRTMTIQDIKNYIDKKVPVIILLQAWNGKITNYTHDFHDGHRVVAIWYDKNKIIFEDPYSFERTFLSYQELEERWHAKEGNKKIIHHGIAVFGDETYHSSKIIHMD